MADRSPVYITTTLPYVNADPHIGHAMEFIRADALARWYAAEGREVFFNTGTDEHGAKIAESAKKEGIDPKTYTDRLSERFRSLYPKLGLAVEEKGIVFNFIRTTDPDHKAAAQEFWKRCDQNGDIYKKEYKVRYCIGCELEKTDSELVDGRCPIHPNRDLEVREEENYFFRFSRYTDALKAHFAAHPDFVIPDSRRNEMLAFLDRGLEDFSISRLKEKMSWGVPVPGDESQVMYVWFDALVNYVSAIGWPKDATKFEKWWPVVQYCGKDNTRQQSLMWQAMLLSAGLPTSERIIVDGFITSGGQKMSKSLGNVINPFDVLALFEGYAMYPEDVLRFVLLHDVPSFEDGDLTIEGIKSSYAARLQNGIGNLTNRIMKLATTHLPSAVDLPSVNETRRHLSGHMEAFDQKRALEYVLKLVTELDERIQSTEPFKVVKVDHEKGKMIIRECVWSLATIATDLAIFLPRTSAKILECIREHKMPERPLFNRLP